MYSKKVKYNIIYVLYSLITRTGSVCNVVGILIPYVFVNVIEILLYLTI